MKRKIILFFVYIIILYIIGCIFSNNVKAAEKYYTESKTDIDYNNYSRNNYIRNDGIVGSYLDKNSDGTLQKIQLVFNSMDISKSKVLIEKYSSNFNYISSKEIKYELQTCAGYYSGEKYNFLVFGQKNFNEDDNTEVIRVVKYDKNWSRISHCSLKAINTYIPFDAGSCRMVEKNGILYIDTCHEMYQTSDGLHHQSNMLIKINEETMERIYARYDVSNIWSGYVSHSFNQYILADDDYIYTIDHGDAYPRAISICKMQINKNYPTEIAYTYLISGTHGNNQTGVSIGGAELSSSSCIIAGNSVKQNPDTSKDSDYNEKRNIFITVTNKNKVSEENTTLKWLTNYQANGDVYCNTPYIIKVNDNKFVVMWEEISSIATNIKAVMIDGNGNYLSNVITIGGRLSDCKPIIYNNKLVWNITTGKKAIFFALDISSATIFNNYSNQGTVDFTKFKHFDYEYNSEIEQYTLGNFDNEVSNITLPQIQNPWMTIELGYQAFYQSNVKNVVIPNGYTKIPSSCFYESSNLEKVTLPSTLEKIGEMAFYNTKIQSITIPDSVTKISRAAFSNMKELTDINLSKNLTEISELLFLGDTLLEKVTIPSSVEIIRKGAFESSGLKSITIPNSVKTIEREAFSNCQKLKGTVVIPANVTTIGDEVFDLDDNIEKLEIKNSNATIGTRILTNDKKMIIGEKYKATTGIKISSAKSSNSNVTVSSDGTITAKTEGTATVECYDSKGNLIVSTWIQVFKQKTPITKLELEKNVAYIKKGEVINIRTYYSPTHTTDYTGIKWSSSNSNVVKVNSLGNITAVANGRATITAICEANESIKAICNIVVADSFNDKFEYKILENNNIKIMKYIGNATNISIPSKIDGYTVIELGDYIFAEYNKHNTTIKTITIPDTVTKIGSSFSYCKSIEQLTIPKSVTLLGQTFASNCDKLKSVNVDSNNKEYKSIDGVVYEIWNNKPYRLILYPEGKQNTQFVIPNEVTTIGNWSLCNNKYLQEIRCLSNVTNISLNSIKNMSNLSKLYILNAKASIGYGNYECINNCPKLTIYGIKDSTAQTYANGHSIKFQAIDYKITALKPEKANYNLEEINVYQTIKVGYEPQLATNTVLTYTSSDNNIVTVDSLGRMKAVGNGTAKITVKTTDGSNKSVNINVNVNIKCTGIRIYNKPTGEITRDVYVTAYAIPFAAKNTTLKYSIKDTKIATVTQSGMIRPLTNGTTELYIETTDGTNIKETIPIIVTGQKEETNKLVTSITITGNDNVFVNETNSLIATIKPEDATNKKITWSSGDNNIATVNEQGIVIGKKTGNVTITAKSTDRSNIIASFEITVKEKEEIKGEEKDKLPFTDVKEKDWYYDSVLYSYNNKIIYGTTNTKFSPNNKLTRGMLVTILWRMEGSQKVSIKAYPDVKETEYYYEAIKWAASKKIVNGYDDGKFRPNNYITREQLATILMNYANYKKKDVKIRQDLTKYTDNKGISSYAKDSVSWAVAKKIISGKENGTKIDPRGTATRAEAAAMITNYCKYVGK